jgi:hypothetical protein
MEIITMEKQAYQRLIEKIDHIYEGIKDLQDPASQIERQWCTTAEAAAIMGINERTLYRYRQRGILEPKKVGNKNFFHVEAVNKLIGLRPDFSNYNPITKSIDGFK